MTYIPPSRRAPGRPLRAPRPIRKITLHCLATGETRTLVLEEIAASGACCALHVEYRHQDGSAYAGAETTGARADVLNALAASLNDAHRHRFEVVTDWRAEGQAPEPC